MTVAEWLTARPADPAETWWRGTWALHYHLMTTAFKTHCAVHGMPETEPVTLSVPAEAFYHMARDQVVAGLQPLNEQLIAELFAHHHPRTEADLQKVNGRVTFSRVSWDKAA